MKKSVLFVFLFSVAVSHADTEGVSAKPVLETGEKITIGTKPVIAPSTGLDAVIARRAMKRLEKRVVAQRMENGNIMSVYDDDSVSTSSVSVVTMTQSTKDKVAELIADRNTLQAAKSLAAKLKTKETKDVADADVLGAVSDSDTDTISAAIVGALVGAAVGVGVGGVKKKTITKEG